MGEDVSATAVDVVIVHYNTPSLLRSCLASLSADPCSSTQQTVVIDNASPDRTVEDVAVEFPTVIFRCQQSNLGFAAACNEGIRSTQAPFCLVLNPDTLVTGQAIATILETMADRADAGIVAPRLVSTDGRLQMSCRRYPTLLAVFLRALRLGGLLPGPLDDYLMREWDHAEQRRVDWVIGGCMLLRRAAVEEIGLLDEGFFLYYEDTDLARRLTKAGWSVYYEPAATVRHEHRRESAVLFPGRATRAHFRSLVRLFRKHRFALW